MTPSRHDLNGRIAIAMGWIVCDAEGPHPRGNYPYVTYFHGNKYNRQGHSLWSAPSTDCIPWDPCRERDLLPCVWRAIAGTRSRIRFAMECTLLIGNSSSVWQYITLQPWIQVVAALKALGQWPDDWVAPTQYDVEAWR